MYSTVTTFLSGPAWHHSRELPVASWCRSAEIMFVLLKLTTVLQAGMKLTEVHDGETVETTKY